MYPISCDRLSLEQIHAALRDSIVSGIELLEAQHPPGLDSSKDGLYTGPSGIALAYLRILQQAPELGLPQELVDRLPGLVKARITLRRGTVTPTRNSPLGTSVGSAAVEIIRQLWTGDNDQQRWDTAVSHLAEAAQAACGSEDDSGDEVLYGRVGMLWTLLNVNAAAKRAQKQDLPELQQFREDAAVKSLVDKIIAAGRRGAEGFEGRSLPLMWEWHYKYYLGAAHGISTCAYNFSLFRALMQQRRRSNSIAGILTVLLQAPPALLEPYLSDVLGTATGLAQLADSRLGNLPDTLPMLCQGSSSSSGSGTSTRQNTVQLFHGSPGLMLLLVALRALHPSAWSENQDFYERALDLGKKALWANGLMKKGLGLCHGMSGNALVLLLASGDDGLGAGLAILHHTTELPPLSDCFANAYALPDHPWSLFEGAAGALAACADAAVAAKGRAEGRLHESPRNVLGMPGLGGIGAKGLL